ncbi:MAG: ornithine cyclodeaminase family protein [Saprospiraceae bacterium]
MSKTNTQTLILSAADIEEIVRAVGINDLMDILIDRMTTAFENFDAGKTIIPTRSGFNYETPVRGLIEWMPLHSKETNRVVVKMVGYHPDNPADFQIPTIVSSISNYDSTTGHLKSIMDGVFLTALRTGAASAIASKVLAHPESSVLGLIGAGAQAVTQLHALSRVFDLQKVMYYDSDQEAQDSFMERVAMLNLNVEFIASSTEEIVTQSDIITTATSIEVGQGPLFENLKTKEWLHVNAIGSDFPGKTELPLSFLRQSFVCPDFMGQAIVEGECQKLKPTEIGPEFFECIQNPQQYVDVKNRTTVFDSTGLPLEDQVVMDLFLEQAISLKLGLEISLEKMSENAKSPYDFLYLNDVVEVKEPVLLEDKKAYKNGVHLNK